MASKKDLAYNRTPVLNYENRKRLGENAYHNSLIPIGEATSGIDETWKNNVNGQLTDMLNRLVAVESAVSNIGNDGDVDLLQVSSDITKLKEDVEHFLVGDQTLEGQGETFQYEKESGGIVTLNAYREINEDVKGELPVDNQNYQPPPTIGELLDLRTFRYPGEIRMMTGYYNWQPETAKGWLPLNDFQWDQSIMAMVDGTHEHNYNNTFHQWSNGQDKIAGENINMNNVNDSKNFPGKLAFLALKDISLFDSQTNPDGEWEAWVKDNHSFEGAMPCGGVPNPKQSQGYQWGNPKVNGPWRSGALPKLTKQHLPDITLDVECEDGTGTGTLVPAIVSPDVTQHNYANGGKTMQRMNIASPGVVRLNDLTNGGTQYEIRMKTFLVRYFVYLDYIYAPDDLIGN